MALLTETADYDEPGSWGRGSDGWPGIKGDKAYDMYVFANCCESIPYGSYVLMSQKGQYKATVSYLRVHADHIDQLKADFKAAGEPDSNESVYRLKKTGKKNKFGNHEAAPKWW
jgi:hypothetical protein